MHHFGFQDPDPEKYVVQCAKYQPNPTILVLRHKSQLLIIYILIVWNLLLNKKESENDLRDLKENIITNIVEYETYW